MNIVLALNKFDSLTGSELYVYDLASCLVKRNHRVTILANGNGGVITDKARSQGIEIYNFFEHPKLHPDVIHSQQPIPTTYTLVTFSSTPHVVTIHSPLVHEKPTKHPLIRKYIAVRPEITHMYSDIDIQTIWNGVDTSRFNTNGTKATEGIIFVGTIDYLRQQAISDIVSRSSREKKRLTIVSPDVIRSHESEGVQFRSATWNIEEYVKSCYETSSVYIGRTTIEGWMCGKSGWVYDVDDEGNIKSVDLYAVPKDLSHFDREVMTDKTLDLYQQVR